MRAVEQLQQDPATTAAFLQNPLFAQMGQMLLSNPAVLQQAERVMSGREPTLARGMEPDPELQTQPQPQPEPQPESRRAGEPEPESHRPAGAGARSHS